jgi:predicted NACHT family NTPase
MSQQVYDWKRFWCSRSSQINLGDRGYLIDPESEYGKHANPELVGLEALINIPCLVLLGEPGIGKSQELIHLRNYTERNLDSGNEILELNLRSCTSLKKDLLQDEQFIAWKDGTHRLYLFLDSLDEGLLQIQTLATQLVDTFKKSQYRDKLSCLYLRIACRTAVFPNILEEGLKGLWQESNVGIYELAPLRRIDVQASVAAHGLDANTFLQEVNRKGVAPFAIKPITLRFLLNTFQKNNGQFPADQKLVDLYLDGCRSLCEEQNQSRRGSRQIGKLGVTQRVIVAARIAAVTVFANRFAVWTEPNSGNVPREDVLLEELCLGDEIANERQLQVTRDAIEEVLDTGLFSSRGSGRIGWAHQTYSEFLAAWYLKQHNLELGHVLNLIIHPDQRVVPQLQETAAWLASMMPEVFQEIIKTDPDILLQSDIATASDIDKASLVESLLQAYDQDKLPYAPFRFWQYEHLSYAGLPNQLQKYIINSSKNTSSRLTAINIAETCKVNAVQESLVDVALNSQDDYQVRVHAISTVSKFCEEDIKSRLKPLAIDNIEDDPDDDLKGYALQAAYPTQISAEEVLKSLKSPNRQIFDGSYQRFLAEIFAKHLQPNNLLVALRWVEEQPNRRDLHYPFDKLSDSILLKAWEYIEDSTILPAFARVVLVRMEKHDAIIQSSYSEFKQQISENDRKRRQLIDAVISMMSDSEQINWVSLCDSQYSQLTLQKSDFLWLFEKLEAASEKHIQEIYASLICQEFIQTGWNDADLASAIIEFGSHNSILREKFLSELAPPIELGSQRAKEEKASYEESQRSLANLSQRNPIPLLEPPPKQRVISVLERIDAEKPELWWQLPTEMSLEPTSSRYHFCDKPDLTEFPGWIEAEIDIRNRIIKTSKIYLEVGQPGDQKLLNISNYSNDEFAGYQALYLLLKQEPEFILMISDQTWTKWIPTILKYTDLCIRDVTQDKYCEGILKKAYEINSNKVIDTLIDFMHLTNYQPLTYHDHDIYRSTKDLIGQPLAKSILSKVNVEDLNPGMLEILLKDLFVDANDEAKMLTLSFIYLPLPILGKARGRALVSARVLLDHVDNSIWPTIWAAIEQDSSFGREVFKYIGRMLIYDESIRQSFQALKEKYLADLFIFLVEQYPEIEIDRAGTTDNKNELVGVSFRISDSNDEVRDWKRYIPQWLQERGTSEACEALRKIVRALPELANDLQWRLLETETAARRNTWNPLRPEDVLRLTLTQNPSTSDLLTPINEINQRTKQMEEQPNVTISGGTFNGPVNLASNQGSQPTTIIGTQNNYFNTDEALRKEIADLNQFISELDAKHPSIQTETEAEQILNDEILAVQTDNPTRWQSLRHQMSLLKRQLLNPERHLQAAKATLIEVTKTAYEKSLIVKAIITYIDKLSEEPNHGA